MTTPPPDAPRTADPMDRRRALTLLAGAGASAIALVACGGDGGDPAAGTTTSTPAAAGAGGNGGSGDRGAGDGDAIPEETAGPYPGDGSNGPNVLTEDGVVRSDIRPSFGPATGSAGGVPLTIDLTVLAAASGEPLAGAAVYVWHCDREARYSMYSEGATDQNYLRGVQEAGPDGRVRFTSIFPAAYAGRWPHVHFEVYPDLATATSAGTPTRTSQLAFPEDTCEAVYATDGYGQSTANLARTPLLSDMVFGDDGAAEQMATMSGSVDRGYTAALAIPV